MTPQRVTLITLGVADLAAARAFYARLGWVEHAQSQPSVAFFQMHGAVLGLFGRERRRNVMESTGKGILGRLFRLLGRS